MYYHVGGSVRDLLLNQKPKDFDVAVVADSFESMVADLKSKKCTIYQTKPEYFTVRANCQDATFLICKAFPKIEVKSCDFVLCRKDGTYRDGRHPHDVSPGTLKEDLARRDFTVNAMAYDPSTDKLIDPFGGQTDLEARLLRCVGDTKTRLTEDPLRMIRAIRFIITKNFSLETKLEQFIKSQENTSLLEVISSERIYQELRTCFAFDTVRTLDTLAQFPNLRNYIFSKKKSLYNLS